MSSGRLWRASTRTRSWPTSRPSNSASGPWLPPFGAATPLALEGGVGPGIRFFERALDHTSQAQWSRSVERTETRFEMLNAIPFGWKCTDEMGTLHLRKAEAGCHIRFIILHPDNPTLPLLYPSDIAAVDLNAAVAELTTITAYLTDLARSHSNISFRQIRTGIPFCEITRIDDHAEYIPFFNSQQLSFLPLWEVGAQHPLFSLLETEFDQLWAAAPEGGQ